MKEYKFENFEGVIVDPVISDLHWTQSYNGTTLEVRAELQTPDNSTLFVAFGVFDYSELPNFDKEDIMDWAVDKIEEFKL
jgi:hypothetical protein